MAHPQTQQQLHLDPSFIPSRLLHLTPGLWYNPARRVLQLRNQLPILDLYIIIKKKTKNKPTTNSFTAMKSNGKENRISIEKKKWISNRGPVLFKLGTLESSSPRWTEEQPFTPSAHVR